MKIRVTQVLDVPIGFICSSSGRNCIALTKVGAPEHSVRLCANFNTYVHWSDQAQGFLRCSKCLDAHIAFYRVDKKQGTV